MNYFVKLFLLYFDLVAHGVVVDIGMAVKLDI